MDYKITITITPLQRDFIIAGLKKIALEWDESAKEYTKPRNQRTKNILLNHAKLCRNTIDEVYAGNVEKID